MQEKIKIKFGVPEHGWLRTHLKYEDFELILHISNVPVDSMYQLRIALTQIMEGIKKTDIVIWHLEPYCYYLQLEKNGEVYKATILESVDFDGNKRVHKEIIGDYKSIILPLYRGLKSFWSYAYKPPHWDELDSKKIAQLCSLIKKRKQS